MATLYNFNKNSFFACYLNGKITNFKPSLNKVELIFLNKKSNLIQTFNRVCSNYNLLSQQLNHQLIQKHAIEAELD